jgi:hypothetical protein
MSSTQITIFTGGQATGKTTKAKALALELAGSEEAIAECEPHQIDDIMLMLEDKKVLLLDALVGGEVESACRSYRNFIADDKPFMVMATQETFLPDGLAESIEIINLDKKDV